MYTNTPYRILGLDSTSLPDWVPSAPPRVLRLQHIVRNLQRARVWLYLSGSPIPPLLRCVDTRAMRHLPARLAHALLGVRVSSGSHGRAQLSRQPVGARA